jgi:folate-dependent phosphoribosylglycinamide formyltransferase PurN
MSERPSPSDRIVLLAGPGVTTDIVYHYLAGRFPHVTVVMERPASRMGLARRRARRLGWWTVLGQMAFIVIAAPIVARRSRARVAAIVTDAGFDVTPIPTSILVDSVNEPATVELLRRLDPAVVVVNGTRIIATSVLEALPAPFVNLHMGITPRYRGVHGGYWALVEGRSDQVGTTIHLVDAGIDTGSVLAQSFFEVTEQDSIATYPYLHLVSGLPLLESSVRDLLAGRRPGSVPAPDDGGRSRLRWHPTLWRYLWARFIHGVR